MHFPSFARLFAIALFFGLIIDISAEVPLNPVFTIVGFVVALGVMFL